MMFGAHISASGGVYKIFARAREVNADILQIFTKNNNRWNTKPYTDDIIKKYFTEKEKYNNPLVFAHSSYLINLCSPKEEVRKKSVGALQDELKRCDILELPYLVMHPGAHLGEGIEQGLYNFSDTLKSVFANFSTKTKILLETTAGQGSSIGHKLQQINELIENNKNIHEFGVCVDTCHIFAAGYDIRTLENVKNFKNEFENIIGLNKIKVIHANDSVKGLGSRVDRHEHIGRGKIGIEGFRFFVNEFRDIPTVLETPKERDGIGDIENLKILRSFLGEEK